MPGDAPARRHTAAQRDARTLAVTPHSTHLPPLVAAEPRSYPPYHGLPGIKPEQPNPPKETASSAGPPTPARPHTKSIDTYCDGGGQGCIIYAAAHSDQGVLYSPSWHV